MQLAVHHLPVLVVALLLRNQVPAVGGGVEQHIVRRLFQRAVEHALEYPVVAFPGIEREVVAEQHEALWQALQLLHHARQVGQVVALDLDQAQPGAGQLGQQRTNQGGLAGPAPPEQGVVGRLAGDELAGVAFQLLALPLYAQQVGQAQVEADLQRLQVAATAVAVPARRQAALPVDGFAYGRQQRLQAREHAFGAGKKIAQSGIHSVLLGSD